MEVAKECSGLSASWLLLAAIIAFESPWKHKLWGFVLGFLTLQIINIVRIIISRKSFARKTYCLKWIYLVSHHHLT
ncbi:MAG: hypothetical protein DRR16_14145 [Candidatus Parabeggiatoa sp. nov. 3]|nr:MAG: hypothetical protein DRR00_27925 [Gammaproteobacteria bacterium]RKZ57810.1 MAG: hypothetical protein DRQ99_26385 [Gammaproteobacteria bacterium]RKZ84666.1 MAG: hypothetical protein DRR16_14145 [Gammaproteobacteria bacterium]